MSVSKSEARQAAITLFDYYMGLIDSPDETSEPRSRVSEYDVTNSSPPPVKTAIVQPLAKTVEEQPAVTLDSFNDLLADYLQDPDKKTVIRATIAKYGAKRLGEVEPSSYRSLYNDLVAALAVTVVETDDLMGGKASDDLFDI